MKYNFETHQVEIENNELLRIIEDILKARYLNLDINGYHLSYRLQDDNITVKIESSDIKASERDIRVFQAMNTLKEELKVDKIIKNFDPPNIQLM